MAAYETRERDVKDVRIEMQEPGPGISPVDVVHIIGMQVGDCAVTEPSPPTTCNAYHVFYIVHRAVHQRGTRWTDCIASLAPGHPVR